MTKYLVLYEQGEDGAWGAYSPDLEGVFALGRTREEVTERMHEAVAAWLELLAEEGKSAPVPCHEVEFIAVPSQVTGRT